jgi:hypothetical protein
VGSFVAHMSLRTGFGIAAAVAVWAPSDVPPPLQATCRIAMQQFHTILGDLAAGRDTPTLRQFLVAAYVLEPQLGFNVFWGVQQVPEAALPRIDGPLDTIAFVPVEAALARITNVCRVNVTSQ